MEPLFDMKAWLGNSQDVYWANRAGIKNLVPLSELPYALDRLVSHGVIRQPEADELLEDLKKESEREC